MKKVSVFRHNSDNNKQIKRLKPNKKKQQRFTCWNMLTEKKRVSKIEKRGKEKRWYIIEMNGSIRSKDQIQCQKKRGEDFAFFSEIKRNYIFPLFRSVVYWHDLMRKNDETDCFSNDTNIYILFSIHIYVLKKNKTLI